MAKQLVRHWPRLMALAIGCAISWSPHSAEAWQGPEGADPSGAEILTQGPVHEAFAEPVVFDPRSSPLVPKEPPPPIEELPPDQKPEGQDVQWISGYWAWDDGRNDFLWISGIWRDLPPGRQWVPGYWAQAQGGFQWVPGTWAPLDQGEAEYLPEPPQSLEAGPNSPAPSPDVTWAPGCWYWQEARYLWRPGYWVPVQQDWLWVPAHYVWTPGGYLFVDGYWDRPIVQRGLVFAPVYFQQPVYLQPSFVYAPTIGIVATALISNLFVRPSYNQYYFGDYYAPNYVQSGIYPWYSFHQSRRGYDPIYSYYAAANRGNPEWGNQLRRQYAYRRDHVEARPPRTFVQQQRVNIKQRNVTNVTTINNIITNNNVEIGRPIAQIAASPRGAQRFERLNEARRREFQSRQVTQREFRQKRASLETRDVRPQPAGEARPRRVEWARSPIAAQALQAPGRGGPPARPNPSRLDRAERPQPPGQARRRGDLDPARVPDGPRPGRPGRGGPDQPRPGIGAEGQPAPARPGLDRPNRPGLDRPNRPERPDRPKDAPRPDRPRPAQLAPGATGRPDSPGPRPERPKAGPRPDRPRPIPPGLQATGQPGQPNPRPERPQATPRPERPMPLRPAQGPGGGPGRPDRPRRNAPGAGAPRPQGQPDARPDAPKAALRPDRPRPAQLRAAQLQLGATGRPDAPSARPGRLQAGPRPDRPRPAQRLRAPGQASAGQPATPTAVPPRARLDRPGPARARIDGPAPSTPRPQARPRPVPPGAGGRPEAAGGQDRPGARRLRRDRAANPGQEPAQNP